MLKFQIKEIEAADLHENEDTNLVAERDRLNNFQKKFMMHYWPAMKVLTAMRMPLDQLIRLVRQ